nr:CDP-glycerol glycerophosphotransferase family protein [uncultured Anaerosporobacter sp.]
MRIIGKKIYVQIRYIAQLFLIPIYLLIYLFPRNKKIWVFGSTFGKRFADNPKYFYLYLSSLKELDIRPIWITRQRCIEEKVKEHGYEVYYCRSLRGIWYTIRAGCYIFDNYSKDISFWNSAGALKVNLWHGIPLKKIQMDNKFDLVRHPKNNLSKVYWSLRRFSDEKPSHYILTTSQKLKGNFSSAFMTKNVLIANYPRNDLIKVQRYVNIFSKEEQQLNVIIQSKIYYKIILYMPTFRNTENKFFDVVNTNSLQQFLEQRNILLVVKLHPKSKLRDEFKSLHGKWIYNISADSDPYTFIEKVDLLITDYSSIYFDYLLTNRNIIFFDYDRKEYLSESREFYYDYDEYTPGPKVETMKSLFDAIDNEIADCNKWKLERERIRSLVFDNYEEYGSQKLYILIREILKI